MRSTRLFRHHYSSFEPVPGSHPDASEQPQRQQSHDHGQPASSGSDGARRGPRNRCERFRKRGNARRRVAAPELAALRLGSKPQLNGRGSIADAKTPIAATSALAGEANASATTKGAKMMAMHSSTAAIFARSRRCFGIGAVSTRSGASSPETVSHARPPASCPADIMSTGTKITATPPSNVKLRHRSTVGAADRATASAIAMRAKGRE